MLSCPKQAARQGIGLGPPATIKGRHTLLYRRPGIPSPKQKPNKKATLADGFSLPADHCDQRGYGAKVLPGIELFLQGATPQLSSPQLRFTTEFEMDRCGSTAPWTPG